MKLLALSCPQCNEPLIPDNDHIVTLCPACQTATLISHAGLARLKIQYATPKPKATITHWQPFWIFHGRVHILKRKIQAGRSRQEESERLWGQPRSLYVPAWDLSMTTAQHVGSRMIEQQPHYQATTLPDQVKLTPVTVTADDALKLLEFVVLAIEARRSDWLKDLDFRLEVDPPVLWALPANDNDIVALVE